jgi:hypothetical protein
MKSVLFPRMRIKHRLNGLWVATRLNRLGKGGWTAIISCLLIAIAAWAVFTFRDGGSDETRYRRAVRNMRLAGWLQPVCRWLPPPLASPLDNFLRKPFHAYNVQEERLLSSGFLTNVSITLSNASLLLSYNLKQSIDEVSRRLRRAAPDSSFLPFSLERDFSNQLVTVRITCRTNDVLRLQKALENYQLMNRWHRGVPTNTFGARECWQRTDVLMRLTRLKPSERRRHRNYHQTIRYRPPIGAIENIPVPSWFRFRPNDRTPFGSGEVSWAVTFKVEGFI